MNTPQTLSAVVKTSLKTKSTSQKKAASKLGLTSEAFRQMLAKNKFREDQLQAMCELIGIVYTSVDGLKKNYLFDIVADRIARKSPVVKRSTSHGEILNSLMLATKRFLEDCQNTIRESILALLRVSGNGDMLVFFVTDKSEAWDFLNSRDVILPLYEALGRGAFILLVQSSFHYDPFNHRLRHCIESSGGKDAILHRCKCLKHDDQRVCLPGASFALVIKSREKRRGMDWVWSMGSIPLRFPESRMVPMREGVTDVLFGIFEDVINSEANRNLLSEEMKTFALEVLYGG